MFDFDVIVLGAGLSGSSAAYFCTRAGKKVLLLEQFNLVHEKGGSYGDSRIFRYTYTVPIYSKMGPEALQLWKEMEKESGIQMYQQTGGLDFGPKSDTNLQATIQVCKDLKIKHELLSARELRARFPMLQVPQGTSSNDENEYVGVYQESAGIMKANDCLRGMHKMILARGGTIRSNEKVVRIEFSKKGGKNLGEEEPVRVWTDKGGSYSARKLIVCAGCWSEKIMNMMGLVLREPFELWRLTYSFWKLQNNPSEYNYKKFPVWIHFGEKVNYGFPEFEKPGYLKAALHYSEERIDPDNRSFEPNKNTLGEISGFLGSTFGNLDSKNPTDSATCLYAVTRDENFVLDTHPENPNVVFFAGDSGHAFKFGSILGKMLYEVAFENSRMKPTTSSSSSSSSTSLLRVGEQEDQTGRKLIACGHDLSLFRIRRILRDYPDLAVVGGPNDPVEKAAVSALAATNLLKRAVPMLNFQENEIKNILEKQEKNMMIKSKL